MKDSFIEHEENFQKWKDDNFPGVKEETKAFIENIINPKKEKQLWKHQLESTLRVIYSYEILGKNNMLLNVVTGGGKTAIIGACIAWLKYAHAQDKFLIIVPNIIVRDRLEKDFVVTKIEDSVFNKFELFPKEAEHFVNELNAHVLEAGSGPQGITESGIILGNIQQFYESNISGKRNLNWLITKVGELAVFNDEAHNTPAREYTTVLKILSHKIKFRLDTTATPDRADGQTPDSEMIYFYGIANALDDGIIKSVVVYQPDAKIIELTYTNKITGENKKVTELDKEFREAESNVKPFQWIIDEEPMKKQIAISLQRFDEQKRRAKERYKPILFIVTMSIEEGKRVKDIFLKAKETGGFGFTNDKVLLVTEDTADNIVTYDSMGNPVTARDAATNLGKVDSPFEVIISVMMLREGWDVPEVSVILLLRKFCSEVYGQQVIGRGLRKIIRIFEEREILAVVDHPKLQHDWLWRKVGASGIRRVETDEVLGDEDIPKTPKIQRLVRPENLIEIPSPEYETKIDFDAIMKKVPKDVIEKNWKQILDSVKYDKEEWIISKTRIEQIRKLYVDRKRKMEIETTEDFEIKSSGEQKEFSKDELIELLKEEVVEMASNLLFEAGFGGLKKGILYNTMMDHIKVKLLNNKNLSDASKEEIEVALANLEDVRKNFSKPIITGILGGRKNAQT